MSDNTPDSKDHESLSHSSYGPAPTGKRMRRLAFRSWFISALIGSTKLLLTKFESDRLLVSRRQPQAAKDRDEPSIIAECQERWPDFQKRQEKIVVFDGLIEATKD